MTDVENREFDDKESSNENEIIFFYVDWCPHCKTARPQWDAVKKTYHGKQWEKEHDLGVS